MTMLFNDLDGLAKHFDEMATRARHRISQSEKLKLTALDMARLQSEAATWTNAAHTVRDTQLTGGTNPPFKGR